MLFSQFITPERVYIDKHSLSKTSALLQVSKIFAGSCANQSVEDLFEAFWNREMLGSTAIGEGIVVPHIRLKTLDHPLACFIKMEHAIDFGAEDKQPGELVVGLVVPHQNINQHLLILSDITQTFQDRRIKELCRQSHDSSQLYHLITSSKKKMYDPACPC